MATEEVEKQKYAKTASSMIEVWASTIDALFQQWLEQGNNEDRLGMTLTSFRLAQVSMMMMEYFRRVGQDFVEGDTEVKACRQAVEHTDTMVRRAMAAAGVGSPESVSVETDQSFN